jgi:hypothetical protein
LLVGYLGGYKVIRFNRFVFVIIALSIPFLMPVSPVSAQFAPQQRSAPVQSAPVLGPASPPALTVPNSPIIATPRFGETLPPFENVAPSTLASIASTRSSSDLLSRLSRLDSLQRSMPQMFADSPAAPLSVVVNDGLIATTDLPLAGGARRMKVAANNRALPQDRVIFQYQMFVSALSADASRFNVGPDSRTINLHQYTIGFEKTFAEGMASIDVRMPFTNQLELATPNFGAEGGQIGNLNVKLKAALFADETYCFSAGMGFEAPTGSPVTFQGNGSQYVVDNEAFFLQPFLAYEERFGDWFVNAFTALDIALNGNEETL